MNVCFSSGKLRVVMIGGTGVGKSNLGNQLTLGYRFFDLIKKAWKTGIAYISKMSPNSVTKECKGVEMDIDGFKLCLVDTPGFFDTRAPKDETITEIRKCTEHIKPGPHAVLIVMKPVRFTEEVVEGVRQMKELFGEGCIEYTCIVFTYTTSQKELDEFVSEINDKGFRQLLQDIKMRYVGVDKFDPSSEENKKQMVTLLDMVLENVKRNKGNCYTSALLDKAAKAETEAEKKAVEKGWLHFLIFS